MYGKPLKWDEFFLKNPVLYSYKKFQFKTLKLLTEMNKEMLLKKLFHSFISTKWISIKYVSRAMKNFQKSPISAKSEQTKVFSKLHIKL